MTQAALFEAALGLVAPWIVESITFQPGATPLAQGTVTIKIGFARGSKFLGSDKQPYTAYDTTPRSWRHLNFFQHICVIEAPQPRVKLASGKVETVEVPWARPGSQFTLLFEQMTMLLIGAEMSLNRVAGVVEISRGCVERIFNHYVEKAIDGMQVGSITSLGIDETSAKKGHQYVTVGVDLATRKVVSVVPGKDANCLGEIRNELEVRGAPVQEITQLSMDMSVAFIAGAAEYFPQASVTFDKFHVVKLINQALDQTRRLEQVGNKAFKKTRYSWLKNKQDLAKGERQSLKDIMASYPTMGKAYRLKLQFSKFWLSEDLPSARGFLKRWITRARKVGSEPFARLADTLEKHMAGILSYVETGLTNGILEAINSKIQLAKRRARGYRNIANFINMIYYMTAGIKINLPTVNR